MSPIRKRGESWEVWAEGPRDPVTGKRWRPTETVKTKKEAKIREAELVLAVGRGEIGRRKNVSVCELAERYLLLKESEVAKNTFVRYRSIVKNHIIPLLGEVSAQKITTSAVNDHYQYLLSDGRLDGGGGLCGTSVRQHHVVLSGIFQLAVVEKIIAGNPASGATLPKKSHYEAAALTAEELGEILVYLEKKNSVIYTPTYIAATTGMRLSEVLGLKWPDIDFSNRKIYVRRTLQRLEGKFFYADLKTRRALRSIHIGKKDVKVLRSWKKKQAKVKLLFGTKNDSVCTKEDGAIACPATVAGRFWRTARVVGYEISFHTLRHTHATLLLKSGELPHIVSARLGHATAAFTMDFYGHVVEKDDAQMADAFENILSGSGK